MRTLFCILMLSLVSVAGGQSRRPVSRLRPEPSKEPETTRYSAEILRNSSVGVQRLDIPGRESANIPQRTRNYLLIALNPVSIGVSGGSTAFEFDLREGGMQIVSGGWPHKLSNKSDDPAHVLAVEISAAIDPEHATCGLSAASCNEVRFGKTDKGEYSQSAIFETATTKLFRADLGPKAILNLHADNRAHLLIALSTVRAHSESETVSLAPGNVHWIFSGFDRLTNDGSDAARFLILEIK